MNSADFHSRSELFLTLFDVSLTSFQILNAQNFNLSAENRPIRRRKMRLKIVSASIHPADDLSGFNPLCS
jgi:hypothetical protein